MIRSGLIIFLLGFLAACSESGPTPQSSNSSKPPSIPASNFTVRQDSSGQFIDWNGDTYRILDPKGARDVTTAELLSALISDLGVSFYLSDGQSGQRVALECILWATPSFGENYHRSCQLPDRVAYTGLRQLEFTPAQWEAFRAEMEQRYPDSLGPAGGTSRSAIILGTIGVRGMTFWAPRHNYMSVDG